MRPWNGKWYVGGGQGAVRLNGDGTWDQGFHFGFSAPLVPSNLFQVGQGGDFVVLPDGGVLLAGSHLLTDPVRGFTGMHQLVWMDSIGELDTTRIHRKANGWLASILQLPDGKFITGGGGVSAYDGRPVGGIIRILPDGALDTTFMSPSFTYGIPYCYFPQPDGKLLVGGVLQLNGGDTLALIRLMPDGSLDPSFNNQLHIRQTYSLNDPRWAPVMSITPHGDDRYIITGRFTHIEGEERGAIAMIDTAGHLVNDHFAAPGCGLVFGSSGTYPDKLLNGILRLSDGKYLIYGGYQGYDDGETNHTGQHGVTRLQSATVGMASLSAGEGPGVRVYPNPATTYATVALETMPRNGQLVLRDALGREVLRQRVAGYHNTVPLQGLDGGVYLLEVWDAAQRVAEQRLVVQLQ
jgi:hypothetical protein